MKTTLLRFIIAAACCLSAATAAADDAPVTFWTGVEHQDFGETSEPLIESWDHKLTSAQLGFDAHVADNLLAGVAVSWSRDEHDISWLGANLDSTLTGIHPHLVWNAPDGQLDWWAAVDYGKGDFDVTEFDLRLSADIYQGTTKIGASRLFLQRGETEYRLKGEVQHARVEVDDGCGRAACIAEIKFDSNRLHMALEASRPNLSEGEQQLQSSLQTGARYYGGNSDGATLEIDGLMRYRNAPRGLTVEARAWALDGISGDEKRNKQWDISATLHLARPNWRGLSFALTSGYGSRASDIHEIWRGGWWTRPLDRNPQAWFLARITYGKTPHPTWTTCPRLQAGC